MGFYGDEVFPRLMNLVMNTRQTRRIRTRVCATLVGEVVEIGFGTGLNLPHLPPTVTVLKAVDPLAHGQALAAKRLASSHVAVEFVGLDGQCLPIDGDSADAVLSTWTLCSIPDPVAAVREIRRVLRPGGTFHFVEHGRSPDAHVLKWQQRLNPLQRRVACGCNLDRDIPSIIETGGLKIDRLESYYIGGAPKVLSWTFEGAAHPANTNK